MKIFTKPRRGIVYLKGQWLSGKTPLYLFKMLVKWQDTDLYLFKMLVKWGDTPVFIQNVG